MKRSRQVTSWEVWYPACSTSCAANSNAMLHALQGAVPVGEVGWEHARVLAGRRAPGAELTGHTLTLKQTLK